MFERICRDIRAQDEAIRRHLSELAMHKGALRIIHVTFSSKAEKTVKALEQDKTSQYRQNRVLHTDYFSPFLVTSNGGWGIR